MADRCPARGIALDWLWGYKLFSIRSESADPDCASKNKIAKGGVCMSTLSKVARISAAMLALAMGLFAAPARVAHATGGAVLTVNSNSDADNGSDGVCTL